MAEARSTHLRGTPGSGAVHTWRGAHSSASRPGESSALSAVFEHSFGLSEIFATAPCGLAKPQCGSRMIAQHIFSPTPPAQLAMDIAQRLLNAENGLHGNPAEKHDKVGRYDLQLQFEPRAAANAGLSPPGIAVTRGTALDSAGYVQSGPVQARASQGVIQCLTRRAAKWAPRGILPCARSLSHEHERRRKGAFAGYCLLPILVEFTGRATPDFSVQTTKFGSTRLSPVAAA